MIFAIGCSFTVSPVRGACRRHSRGCWCGCGSRRCCPGAPTFPRMMTPVGQRSTHRAQRVQMSSSMMNSTLSLGSVPGCLGARRLGDGRRVDHVDALPRADVDAALAHDALGLVDVDELLGLDRLGEVVGVDLDELVRRRCTASSAGWHRSCHASGLLHQRAAVGGRWRRRCRQRPPSCHASATSPTGRSWRPKNHRWMTTTIDVADGLVLQGDREVAAGGLRLEDVERARR